MTESVNNLPVLLPWTDKVLKPDFDRLHPNLSAKHADLITILRAEASVALTEGLQNSSPSPPERQYQLRLPFPLPVHCPSQFIQRTDNLFSTCRNQSLMPALCRYCGNSNLR